MSLRCFVAVFALLFSQPTIKQNNFKPTTHKPYILKAQKFTYTSEHKFIIENIQANMNQNKTVLHIHTKTTLLYYFALTSHSYSSWQQRLSTLNTLYFKKSQIMFLHAVVLFKELIRKHSNMNSSSTVKYTVTYTLPKLLHAR